MQLHQPLCFTPLSLSTIQRWAGFCITHQTINSHFIFSGSEKEAKMEMVHGEHLDIPSQQSSSVRGLGLMGLSSDSL